MGRAADIRFRLRARARAHAWPLRLRRSARNSSTSKTRWNTCASNRREPRGDRAARHREAVGAGEWPALRRASRRDRWASRGGRGRWPVAAAVRVLPDLFRNAGEVKGISASGSQAGIDSGAGAEVLRLRDYRAGDPPRVIDWKATARADRLISREFAQDARTANRHRHRRRPLQRAARRFAGSLRPLCERRRPIGAIRGGSAMTLWAWWYTRIGRWRRSPPARGPNAVARLRECARGVTHRTLRNPIPCTPPRGFVRWSAIAASS